MYGSIVSVSASSATAVAAEAAGAADAAETDVAAGALTGAGRGAAGAAGPAPRSTDPCGTAGNDRAWVRISAIERLSLPARSRASAIRRAMTAGEVARTAAHL